MCLCVYVSVDVLTHTHIDTTVASQDLFCACDSSLAPTSRIRFPEANKRKLTSDHPINPGEQDECRMSEAKKLMRHVVSDIRTTNKPIVTLWPNCPAAIQPQA